MPYTGTVQAGVLSRSVTVGILDVTGGPTIRGLVPPSRVGDLRVQINTATQHTTFLWTAPGEERDHEKGQ